MADAPSRPEKSAARPRKEPARPPAESALAPLRVSYYRRMSRQRVYAVTVGWHSRGKAPPPAGPKVGPVSVRLIMAGAQVIPSEQALNPRRPETSATFYVTPLARGWLRAERLEVIADGRKVHEVRLPTKVVSQRPTWVLLALTLLVPWFLLTYFRYDPLRDGLLTPGQTLERRILENVPEFPGFVGENAPQVASWVEEIPRQLGAWYDVGQRHVQETPVAFYAAAVLLVLTLLSWVSRRDRRKVIRTGPLPLPRGAADAPAVAARPG